MTVGDRSKGIYGRIHRILTKNLEQGVTEILKEEIYDEMQQAQIQIFTEVLPERTIEVSLIEDESEYPLFESSMLKREIIHKIKSVITPSSWDYKLEFLSNSQWNETVKSTTNATQPFKGTIIENVLRLFPTPDSTYDGAELSFIALLKGPTTTISDRIDPELPELFDKPLEWLTLFNLTQDPKYFTLATEYIKRKLNYANISADEENVKECNW